MRHKEKRAAFQIKEKSFELRKQKYIPGNEQQTSLNGAQKRSSAQRHDRKIEADKLESIFGGL